MAQRITLALTILILAVVLLALHANAEEVEVDPTWPDYQCIVCHLETTPGHTRQFLEGAMGRPGIQNPDVANALGGMERVPCTTCHGAEHTSADDWKEARLPDHTTCQGCHYKQVQEFLSGKHAYAWRAMMAIPMVKKMPKEELLHGCGGCHKIGVKSPEELLELGLERPYGIGATCDQCHTRHRFSTYEARQPETCAKCHMGFDHPQWEMWKTSKHGLIYFSRKHEYPLNTSLKYVKPEDYPGPTCQLCHMPKGNHSVITPWGFVALVAFEGRPSGLDIVNDPEWEEAKVEFLKALRVLDPEGNPTPLLNAVAELKLVRLTPEEFMDARKRIIEVCTSCHSRDYVVAYIKAADEVIKHSTIQLAKAITLIKEAREKGIVPPREDEPDNPYPFLLNFYEEPSGIEREAWLIFLEYRMRAFQGMFHVNPDYTHWYGWSEIKRAVGDIEEKIQELARIKSIEEGYSALSQKIKEIKPVTVTETETRTIEKTTTRTTTAYKTVTTERTVESTVTMTEIKPTTIVKQETVTERVGYTAAHLAAVAVIVAAVVLATTRLLSRS